MIRQSQYAPNAQGFYIFEVQCDFCKGRGGPIFLSPTRNPVDAVRWPALKDGKWKHAWCWKQAKQNRKAKRARRLARQAALGAQVPL